jgi:hypothetical protein
MADRNVDGLMGQRKTQGCRNWLADVQDRGRWRHLLKETKAHPRVIALMMIQKTLRLVCRISNLKSLRTGRFLESANSLQSFLVSPVLNKALKWF